MSNPGSCPDLCTAAKCQELEARINVLESDFALLKASFDAHIKQEIPEAHQYKPKVRVNNVIEDNTLITDVSVDSESDFSEVPLTFDPFVTFDIFPISDNQYEFKVQVNGNNDSDILTLDNNEDILDVTVGLTSQDEVEVSIQLNDKSASDSTILPNSNVSLDVFDNTDESALIKAQVGKDSDEDIIFFPEQKHIESNLSLSASYRSDILTITVADGESQDSTEVFIDAENIINNRGGEGMSCDNLDLKLDDIIRLLQLVLQHVSIEIIGKANSEYKCEFPSDDNDNLISTYAESIVVEKDYQGIGLSGIHENLKLIHQNLDSLHDDVCKSVDPISTLTVDDLFQFCDKSGINRTDFDDNSIGQDKYDQAINDYFKEQIADTKFADLAEKAIEGKLITAPNNYIVPLLIQFALVQGAITNQEICNLEPTDIVSLVASPKYVTNIDGKVLVLHFVSLDNYPKRQRNSSYRPIQIPGAKEEYNWEEHFENLRWEQGNQYAELMLKGYRARVSGWFKDKVAADSYFDQVLELTIAEEENRNYPERKHSRTNISTQITRPYRAFIESVNDQGQAICHVKYVPVIEEKQ